MLIRFKFFLLISILHTACSGNSASDVASDDNAKPSGSKYTVKSEKLTEMPGSVVYYPEGLSDAPGIVFLHGSEGGGDDAPYTREFAEYAAGQGFATLAFCYYKCPGLSDKLARISLDKTESAIQWLKNSKYVNSKKVGLYGASRGAEQSILLASKIQTSTLIAAVFVHASYEEIVSSHDPIAQKHVEEKDSTASQPKIAPAWTYKGKDMQGAIWNDQGLVSHGPKIEIEKYSGPLFLSHGTLDEDWPVENSKNLEATRKKQPSLITKSKYWEGEGHVLKKQENYQELDRLFVEFFQEHLN